MPKFLVIAITNNSTLFIYDTYNDYIIESANLVDAVGEANNNIPYIKDIDEAKPITEESANALMKINRTKQISPNVTQIIMF